MISNEHIKILKMLLKRNSYFVSNPEPIGNQLHYLATLGYVRLVENINEYGEASKPRYIITESGKAFLHTHKIENRRWHINTAISIVALITAIAAIALSPFFTTFFTKLYGL